MGSSDSFSVPSEPPDVRNWFSSYVYQSPDLNSIDDLKDCNESRRIGFRDNENEKENLHILLVETKKASTGSGDNKNTNEDFGSLDSLSLSSASEPPDIRNWFSSYEYESPALDGSVGFGISDHNGKNSTSKEQGATINKDKENDFKDSCEAQRCDLVDRDVDVTSGLVKCIRNVKDNKNGNQQICENHEAIWKTNLNENLKTRENYENGSSKEIVNNGSSDGVLKTKSSGEASYKLLEINDSDHHGGKSPKKFSENLRAKHSAELIRSVVDEKSSKEAIGRSDEKENYGAAFPENGFISTRTKVKRLHDENYLPKPLGGQCSCSKARLTESSSTKKDALVGRKILSERTNFQEPNIPEITGKWRCPQKSKPSLGPPLKQLRLEQWVRRA